MKFSMYLAYNVVSPSKVAGDKTGEGKRRFGNNIQTNERKQ